jgi:hypothetical protein
VQSNKIIKLQKFLNKFFSKTAGNKRHKDAMTEFAEQEATQLSMGNQLTVQLAISRKLIQ